MIVAVLEHCEKIKKNVNQSSSSEGGPSVGCVGAMRCLRGDLVEEIVHHDGLAQKCISPPCTSAVQKSKIQASLYTVDEAPTGQDVTWVVHSGWVGRHRVKRVGLSGRTP